MHIDVSSTWPRTSADIASVRFRETVRSAPAGVNIFGTCIACKCLLKVML